jgi:hypothetical protein
MDYDAILNVLFGMALGVSMVVLYAWYQFQLLKSQIEEIIDQAVEEKSSIELDIEVDKGVYFCYNSESKQFVCQGTTAVEIRQALQNRFPNRTAYLVGGDPIIKAKFKAELETNENSTSI